MAGGSVCGFNGRAADVLEGGHLGVEPCCLTFEVRRKLQLAAICRLD